MAYETTKSVANTIIEEVADTRINVPKDKSEKIYRRAVVSIETGAFGVTSLGVVLGRVHPIIPLAVAGGSALLNSKMFKEILNDESEKEN